MPSSFNESFKTKEEMNMKKMIKENQKGLLYRYGKLTKVLNPGLHNYYLSGYTVEVMNVFEPFRSETLPVEIAMNHELLKSELECIQVSDEMVVLHYINDQFAACLTKGTYAFFKAYQNHQFLTISIRDNYVSDDMPKHVFESIPHDLYRHEIIAEYQKGIVIINGKIERVLDKGHHYFWLNHNDLEIVIVDTRLKQMELVGQELLTLDKVALRINFVCRYKIIDYVKLVTEVEDFENMMHVTLQLALRAYVGKYRLDEILENKEGIALYAFEKLKEKEASLYMHVEDAGVKDIILPGEIREIMNTVLIAEKKAQANVITRREEVASTRSLLNTAKLMDENKTLYKLKELEYVERICQNVREINVGTQNDILTTMTSLLKG